MEISIRKIENGVIWMVFKDADGKEIFTEPLAAALRRHLQPERDIDRMRGDGWNTEQAFKKLELTESLNSELKRA